MHIRLFALLALVPLASLLRAQAPTAPASATPASWLQLGNASDNAGFLPGTLDVHWSFKSDRTVRGLSVADGIVVIGTESADADAPPDKFGPDQHGVVRALDVTTGKVLWTATVPNWVHGDPAIHAGRVFVDYGSWPLTRAGGVTAFDLHTGRQLWSFPTAVGLMTAPVLDTASRSLLVAGGEALLYELSPDSGTQRRAIGLRAPAAMSSPRLGGRDIYVGGTGALTSYSIERKSINWRSRTPAMFGLGNIPVALTDTIVYTSGLTYAGFANAYHALPTAAFFGLLQQQASMNAWSTYRTWFQQLWLVAFSRRDGHMLWSRPLGIGVDVPRNSSGTPAVAAGRVYISSPHNKTIHAFDARTGAVLWARPLDAMQKGAPTIHGDELLIGDRTGTVHILSAKSGKTLGRCKASGAFTVLAPIVIGKTLFAATKDGWVHAASYDSVRTRALTPGVPACFS